MLCVVTRAAGALGREATEARHIGPRLPLASRALPWPQAAKSRLIMESRCISKHQGRSPLPVTFNDILHYARTARRISEANT